MPLNGTVAHDLITALDEINTALEDGSSAGLASLPRLRLKVMRLLTSHLVHLHERCEALRSGTDADRCLSKVIQEDVHQMRSQVNAHVSRWTPTAIASDQASYRDASDILQQNIRKIARYNP